MFTSLMFATFFAISLNFGSIKVFATSSETSATASSSTTTSTEASGPVWQRTWNDSYKDYPSPSPSASETVPVVPATTEPTVEPTMPTIEPTLPPVTEYYPTTDPTYVEPSYTNAFWAEETTNNSYDDFWDDPTPDPNLPDNSFNENVVVKVQVPDYTPPTFDAKNAIEIQMPDGRIFNLNKRGNGLYYVYDEENNALGYVKSETEPTVEDFINLEDVLLPFGKKNPETSDLSGVLIPFTIILLGASFFVYTKYFRHLKED